MNFSQSVMICVFKFSIQQSVTMRGGMPGHLYELSTAWKNMSDSSKFGEITFERKLNFC